MAQSPLAQPKPMVVLAGLIIAVGLVLPVMAAAEDSADRARVAMASDLRIFSTQSNPVHSDEELQAAMLRGAEQQWRSYNSRVTVVTDNEVDQAVVDAAMYDGNLELAREWGQMGIEAYKRVQTQSATDYLERSLQYFETISHDLVAPEEVSEILMYLALSYLEDGTNVVRPLDVLQEMIRRDPSRRLERGYYPDFIVQYYENARETLWRQLLEEGPPRGESERIAGISGADFIFHGYAVPNEEESVELIAYLYDVQQQELLDPERLTLEDVDVVNLQEGFGRLASRLSACLIEATPDSGGPGELVASRGTSRLSIQLGMSYGSFLQMPDPLEDPFGNYGVGLGLGWSLTREFQLIGTLNITNSMRDYAGVLRDDFTTIRAMVGGELGSSWGPLSFGLGAGVEANRIGPVQVFTDKSCIPDPDRLCPDGAGTARYSEHGLHWGVKLRPRIALSMSDSFELSSAIGVGYYFSPLDSRLFNFPVTTEMGIEYRF